MLSARRAVIGIRRLNGAIAEARSRHRPVVIASLTTQTTEVKANPDDSFTMISNTLPVRVRSGGVWKHVSPALRPGPGGTWTTTATPSRLTLSGGGAGPMAVLTSPAGGRRSLAFPGRLPAPVVHGATAVYRNVLPGVTLRLTATALGGLTETLTTATHQAAVSPRFRRLRLALRASNGLRVSSTSPDIATAPPGESVKTNRAGYTEVQAGCPNTTNWNNTDQYGNGVGLNDFGGACQGAYRAYYQIDTSGLVALKNDGTVEVQDAVFSADENFSSDFGCSDTWPVSLHLTDGISSSTDWNNKPANYSGDQVKTINPQRGPNPNSNCTTQLLQFDIPYAMNDALSSNWATTTFGLQGDETASQHGDPSGILGACGTGDDGGNSSAGYNCSFMRVGDNPSITTNFDIIPPAPFCASSSSTIQNASTTNSCDTQIIPAPLDSPGVTDFGCGTATGWINQNTNIKFKVVAQAAIQGESVSVTDNVWDNSENAASVGNVTSEYFATDGSAANITIPTATVLPVTLKNGHQYGWDATANVNGDGQDNSSTGYSSPISGHCRFNVDTAAPAGLTVTSSQFPSSASGQSGQDAGTTGTFTFSAADPVPAGCATTCQASGVYEFTYQLNGGPQATVKPAAASSPGATQTASVPLPIGDWGTNVLSVTAEDNAGNVVTTPINYTFYAPWNPSTIVTNGDVNGDSIPDLLGTTSTSLILYPGDTNPASAVQSGAGCGSPAAVYNGPCVAAPESGSPDGGPWNGFLITHRGSMSAENVDDLFALNKTTGNLYIINNNPSDLGAAPQLSTANTSSTHLIADHPVCAATTDNAANCTGYPGGTSNPNTTSWAGVQQLLAVGDAWAQGPPLPGRPTTPD